MEKENPQRVPMRREPVPGLASFGDGSLVAVSCLEKAQRCPHGDFRNRKPSDTRESASSGRALLIGLRLLASGFLLLDSHLHRVFLSPLRLLDFSSLLPQRASPGSASSPESSAACGLSTPLLSDTCPPAF